MGPKECLSFFEGILLPANNDRQIVLKLGSQDVAYCRAFFKVMMKYFKDRKIKALGESPILPDDEQQEIT